MNDPEFYERLQRELEETTAFPSLYLFKFIVPNTSENITQTQNIFDHSGAVITTKPSKNGKYMAISVQVEMTSAALIIEKYKQAAQIPGIVSL